VNGNQQGLRRGMIKLTNLTLWLWNGGVQGEEKWWLLGPSIGKTELSFDPMQKKPQPANQSEWHSLHCLAKFCSWHGEGKKTGQSFLKLLPGRFAYFISAPILEESSSFGACDQRPKFPSCSAEWSVPQIIMTVLLDGYLVHSKLLRLSTWCRLLNPELQWSIKRKTNTYLTTADTCLWSHGWDL